MKIGILGAGESGLGAALLAKKLEYNVFVSDASEINKDFKAELIKNKIPFEEKGHTIERLVKVDLVIKSPGVAETTEVVQSLRHAEIDVIGEVEFASQHCNGQIIAITGSNGKTTTAMLCHHMLKSQGVDAVLCGNVGWSMARAVADGAHDWFVVEVSSFQLDDCYTFRPRCAVILNITPDHLDRYGGEFERYARSKMRIAQGMQDGDMLVVSALDTVIEERLKDVADGVALHKVDGTKLMSQLDQRRLPGRHNALNAESALAVCIAMELDTEKCMESLDAFVLAPHRMEFVGELDGVGYINDSKATNVDAVIFALEAIRQPIIWIAGGEDKGNDYALLEAEVNKKVKMLICLGIDNKKLIENFSNKVMTIKETTKITEALKIAKANATPGDIVLLSPACTSFDLFNNYKDRGDQFRSAVMEMIIKE